MPVEDIETFRLDGQWRNKVVVLSGQFDTQEEAIESARELAQARQVRHVVRNADGSVREEHDYRGAESCGGEYDHPARETG